ncbi:MAG: UDP-N-acetylmuramoyl-L-alanyl-D-glutamate--2,6-diaminopimelate ligase [Nocardioidaceae bacterium]
MNARTRPQQVVPVPISELAALLGVRGPGLDTTVTGVTHRSDSVRPGDLYTGLPGAHTHGARFVDDAQRSGATAVLTDPEGAEIAGDLGLPTLVVERPRRVLGSVAALVYGHPADGLTVIGVTGTQGKTTTTWLMAAGLVSARRRTALIGTMGTWIDDAALSSALTTPEAPDLHALFAVMLEEGVDVCTMEVSSHSLAMGRVNGVVFDLAVFTNFGRDHLDFHGSVEEYFATKADLFTPERARRALLNADDAEVAQLLDHPQIPTHTFSSSGSAAHWSVADVATTGTGSSFRLIGPDVDIAASTGLSGAFNVANALCSLAALGEIGVDIEAAASGVARCAAVPGRMERIECGQPFGVVVDYAHKPDALAAALTALRPLTRGRLSVVVGAGGDRDRGKRVIMGEIAARLSDVVIVTDDNPRSEDPETVRTEIIRGTQGSRARVHDIGDRRSAIEYALRAAAPGDTVLIAGKGHETGQQVNAEVLPFDDRAVAREVTEKLADPRGRP